MLRLLDSSLVLRLGRSLARVGTSAGTSAIIGIAFKDKSQDTTRFLKQYGNPFQIVLMDETGVTARQWGAYGVPETFLLDADRTVLLRHAGPIDKQILEDVLKPAVAALD